MLFLPVPDDASSLAPEAINDAGEVAGMIIGKDRLSREAFVWSASKGLRRSGEISAVIGGLVVSAISSTGVVVGYVVGFQAPAAEGFAWSADRGLITPPGLRFFPRAVNSSESMVGFDGSGPAKWSAQRGFESLGATNNCTGPVGINDSDEIVGWSGKEGQMGCDETSWVLWRNGGKPTEIKYCQVAAAVCDVVAINATGLVAGTIGNAAFRMSTRPGDVVSQELPNASVRGLNDRGDVVGISGRRPYLWTADGQLHLLNLPTGYAGGWAGAVNNRGEVVGMISPQ